MDARIQSALLAGIVSLALALAMLLRRNRTRLWTAFAFLNLSLFLYQLGDFLLGVLAYKAVWPYRLTLAAAGFIPAAVLEFLVAFQGDSGGRAVALRRLAVSVSALMVGIGLSPPAPPRGPGGAAELHLPLAPRGGLAPLRPHAPRGEPHRTAAPLLPVGGRRA